MMTIPSRLRAVAVASGLGLALLSGCAERGGDGVDPNSGSGQSRTETRGSTTAPGGVDPATGKSADTGTAGYGNADGPRPEGKSDELLTPDTSAQGTPVGSTRDASPTSSK